MFLYMITAENTITYQYNVYFTQNSKFTLLNATHSTLNHKDTKTFLTPLNKL